MTREEAIEILHYECDALSDARDSDYSGVEALQMAINALDQPEPNYDEWCETCKEYDAERHCCPRFNHVIQETVQEMRGGQDG